MGWDGYPGMSPQKARKTHLADLKVIETSAFTREPGPATGSRTRGEMGHFWVLCQGWKTGNPIILQVIQDGTMFKDVDESMGPLAYDVPVSWLDKAPLAPGPFSEEFREKVYGYWAVKEREASEALN